MKLEALSQALCLLPVFLPLVSGAPARRDSNPPLRATESLVGYSPSENVATGSKPDIKYSLLPGQKENADVGAYLDFENVANPQPIRGSIGSDDPGPREFASIFPRFICSFRIQGTITMTELIVTSWHLPEPTMVKPLTHNGLLVCCCWTSCKKVHRC